MKLGRQKTERRMTAKVLLEGSRQEEKSLIESLDFLQPGDIRLIQQIGVDRFSEKRDSKAALQLPGLIFSEAPLSLEFKQQREEAIHQCRLDFESWVTRPAQDFEVRNELSKFMEAADAIFFFRSLIAEEIPRPSQEAWEVIQRKGRELATQPRGGPTGWLVKLLYIDPIRFKSLPADELSELCIKEIAKERNEYPLSKDKRQIRLLFVLAMTRLMFPDMADALTLSTEEREVTRQYVQAQRRQAESNEGSGLAFYLFLLSLVEAPGLRVDEKGVHLSGQKQLRAKSPDLPVRPVL